jgi:hypothetical protein
MNPMDLKRGIDSAVETVINDLKSSSKKISSSEEVAQVGTISPTSGSPFADIVPTCATSSLELIFLELLFRSLITVSTAESIPLFKSIGFMPAATYLQPSLTIASAKIVAVVVPSPASSLVLLATSFTICAPIFSNLSTSSISFATVTPSLVIRGAPKDLSKITFLPFGPRVILTESERILIPLSIFVLASELNLTSLPAIFLTS